MKNKNLVNSFKKLSSQQQLVNEFKKAAKEIGEGEGFNPAIYKPLKEAVEKGLSYTEAKKYVESKVEGMVLGEADYKQMREKLFPKNSLGVIDSEGRAQLWP